MDQRTCDAAECFGVAMATEDGRLWCRGHLKQLREYDNWIQQGTFDWMRQRWESRPELEEA